MQSSNESSRYRWTIMVVVWLVYFNVSMMRLSPGPLAPFLKESLQLSTVQVNLLVTAINVTYLPSLLMAGWLVDRVGVRRVMFSGTIIGGLAAMAVFFLPNYQSMVIVMAISGLGFGCVLPSAVKALMLWFPASERATALGINQTSFNAAGVLSAILLPIIATALAWQYSFLFLGIGTLVICLGTAIFYRDAPSPVIRTTAPGKTSAPTTRRFAVFRSRDIWMLGLSGFFLCVIEFAVTSNLVLYLNEGLSFDVLMAGGLLAIAQLAGAVGKPASGIISDRLFGSHRKPVYLLMCGIATIACLLLTITSGQKWLIYLTVAVLGAMVIGFSGIYITLAGELAGRESVGVATGFSTGTLALSAMVGPPVFGYIVDRTGSFQTAWLVMTFFGVASVIFGLMIREHKRRL